MNELMNDGLVFEMCDQIGYCHVKLNEWLRLDFKNQMYIVPNSAFLLEYREKPFR